MTAQPVARPAQTELRVPAQVMRLQRMGCSYPTRLSFLRILLRRLAAQRVRVTRPVWDLDTCGYGRAVYTLSHGGHRYSLVAFCAALDPENRTDRVIATAWDATFVLFDGVPGESDLRRLAIQTPLQEAGRFSPSELILSRANKSVRLFEHVADALARGVQPDEQQILDIGYLMRTTAVYGNGKFGIADRASYAGRSGMLEPFQAELLCVWLIRGFTHDLVEHVAKQRGADRFVPLSQRYKRYLGIGNATGLGMAPFLVSHPLLINNWMQVRETALARVRAIKAASRTSINCVQHLLQRAQSHLRQWQIDEPLHRERLDVLTGELRQLSDWASTEQLTGPDPWDRMLAKTGQLSLECQELIVALLLEPHGDLIDGLSHCLSSSHEPRLEPGMSTAALRQSIESNFDWALQIDFSEARQQQQFWYVSEDKLEPRLGDRYAEPGAELELPLDIARQIQRLHAELLADDRCVSVSELLQTRPQLRFAVRRVQANVHHPYSEIRDNLIASSCLPIDMLRCKLAFFGASKFDPRSQRWTRITLCQGAPLANDWQVPDLDDWWLPVLSPLPA